MRLLQVLESIVPAKVRTNYGPRSEEILPAFSKAPSASAREAPTLEATQRFGSSDIWPSVVPLHSCLLAVGFWAHG